MKRAAMSAARTELFRILRFGIVGGGATVTHIAVANLANWLQVTPWLAFLLGFVVAFGVSYLGHRHFTFGHESKGSLAKFFIVAVLGLGVGELVLHLLEGLDFAPNAVNLTLSVFVIPPATYLAAKFWAFKPTA